MAALFVLATVASWPGYEGHTNRSVPDSGTVAEGFGEIGFPAPGFVHLDGSMSAGDVRSDLAASGIECLSTYTIIPAMRVVIPDASALHRASLLDGISRIEASPEVVPMMDTSVKAIKASSSAEYSPDTAQDLGYTGRGVTIAFIDSGVDDEHATFSGAFVAGADFTRPTTPLTPRDGSYNPDDDNGHGTATSSIALGRGDGEGNYIGVAPGAGLIDLKVIGYQANPLNPLADTGGNMVDALQWCVDHRTQQWNGTDHVGIGVISISLGIGSIDGAVAMAVQATVEAGIPVVLAAGNTGGEYSEQTQTSWPDGAIVVSGIDDKGTVTRDDDEAWSGSTYGPRSDDGDQDVYDELKPDVSAPCFAIMTAQFSRFSNVQPASSWTEGSGTSFAAPHVSGTVALMLESSTEMALTDGRNPLKLCLHRGAQPEGMAYDPDLSEKYDPHYGFGYLDAYESLRSARAYTGGNSAPSIGIIEAQPDPVPRGADCQVTVHASDPDEDVLAYDLKADAGTVSGDGPVFTWSAPDRAGNFTLTATVTDGTGTDEGVLGIEVLQEAQNVPPLISSMRASPDTVPVGGTSTITTVARDQDGDDLTYAYTASVGEIEGSGPTVIFTAPDTPGDARIGVTVTDGRGGRADRDIVVSVREEVENSDPIIVLVEVTPSSLGSKEADLFVRAQVQDPDGAQDISTVSCDLSELGLGSEVAMMDNGTDGDLVAGDGIYSIKMPGVGPFKTGNYTITVVVFDQRGASTYARTFLSVKGSGSGTIEIGTTGADPLMVFFIIVTVAVALLILVVVWVAVARSRSRKRALGPGS